MSAGDPGFGEALLDAWPRPAAILDENGRLLAWNRDFALRMGPEALWRGRLPSRQNLVSRSLEGGLTLVEWNAEEAAMGEARRLCHEEMTAKLDALSGMRDLQAMRAEAHAIRGLAANFGLLTLLPASQALEEACRAGDAAGASAALDRLRQEAGPALRELASQPG